jgi:long-chain acyl-CoA synthetase
MYFDKVPIIKALIVYGYKENRNSLIGALVHPNYEYVAGAGIQNIQKAIEEEVDKINYGLPTFKRIEKVEIHEEDFQRTRLGKIKRHKHVENAF